MNLEPYIESGLLELYVLDNLSPAERNGVERMLAIYPTLKVEILKIELALERYAKLQAVTPSTILEDIVINRILNLSKTEILDISNLPLINGDSDYQKWQTLIDTLSIEPLSDRTVKVLRHDAEVTQMLIISTTDIEEEIHENEHESFLILAGTCKCTIGDHVRFMKAGDFMQIPLYIPHDVEILSEQVTAILQRVKL